MCSHEDRKVKKVINHEHFARGTLRNDVALVILDEDYVLTPFINVVCLPPSDTNFDNQRCFTGGWGKDRFGRKGIFQNILKKVELQIVPREKCQEQLRKIRLGEDFILHDGFLCAGNLGTTCLTI